MAWRDYKYDELLEEGAGHRLLAQPPELEEEAHVARLTRAQLHATYALACFALARELREADQHQQ
jgi:hypothetical protein